MQVHCHNCNKTSENFRPLNEVKNLIEHLYPGDEVPAGECLECGALVYHTDEDRRLDRAIGILQRDYFKDVNDIAELVQDEIKSGQITNDEQLSEYLHETIDSAHRVIFTREAKLGLVFSDNDEAYHESFGGDLPNYSVMMYCALEADVNERLDITRCELCDNFATAEHDGTNLCPDCLKDCQEEDEEKDDE